MIKNNIKKQIIIFFSIFSVFLLISLFPTIKMVNAEDASYGLDATTGVGGNVGQLKETDDPKIIIGKIVGEVLAFVGVLFLLLMIYGGFKYMTSMGNETEVGNAKNLIKYAIIGIIIILSAYAITAFIGETLT